MTDKNKNEIIAWAKTIGVALVLAFVINKGIIVNATVPSASMESTIMVGDRLIANRLAYLRAEPERGDVITFRFEEDEGKMYVKRLIGLPGDLVEIIDGKVYIDSIALEEPYLNAELDTRSFGPYIVPEDHYFFLGDNRTNSRDSRLWENPYIDREALKGKVILGYYPKVHIF